MSKKGAGSAEKEWNISSWRNFPIKQQPSYEDKTKLAKVETELKKAPPLVYIEEIKKLHAQLAKVSAGEAFLLQGGDCAESFAEFNDINLRNFFRVIVQ